MGFLDRFRKKKVVPNNDDTRRKLLLSGGRITEGTIIDSEVSDSGDEIVHYFYNIQGVDFESSDILTDKQKANSIKYAPGAKVSIRFDPKNHGNCILV
jgi:hypothetical protein